MRKILFGILIFVLLVVYPKITWAANEFSSSYDINYTVLEDGTTEVTEDIKLKNQTDKFFPSNFSLLVPGNEISDVIASDIQGVLETETIVEGSNTKIIVKFTNQQIIGLGKIYPFTLKFKDKGIAKSLGKVWSIKIARISQSSVVEDFKLVLSVPTGFGDPDYIIPKPAKVNESGGRINFTFEDTPFFQSGVSAIFGESLNFSFESLYSLKNTSIFPKYLSIPIGLNSDFQSAFIESIEPRPESTQIDDLGNTLAFFKINPGQNLDVKVTGYFTTKLDNLNKQVLNSSQFQLYLGTNKYWDVNNPLLKARLGEILNGKEDWSMLDKAKEIDKFVSNFLHFDYSRIEKNDFSRFGSVTALNNPDKALSAEFVDLEIALLRSAGIPARQVVGFDFPEKEKPFAYKNLSLHSWVEIYIPDIGWFIADPAWQNTTGQTAMFNFNDLNHIGLAYSNGGDQLVLPEKVEVKVFEGEVQEKKGAELDIKVEKEILSGFPSKAKIKINNLGNKSFPQSELKIDAAKILLEVNGNKPSVTYITQTPEIPPFGNIEYEVNLKTGAIWHSYQDAFQVNFAGVTDTRVITVKPILSYKIFAVEMFGGLTMIFLFYILVLLIHHKSSKSG